jgi:hypothetical protein
MTVGSTIEVARFGIGVVFGASLLGLALGIALVLLSRGVGRVGGRGLEVCEALHPPGKRPLARVSVFAHDVSRVLETAKCAV